MNLLVLLDVRIAFGLVEIIIFQLGALILGFSIHFFFASRKSISSVPEAALPKEPGISEAEEWRLKYYDEVDDHQKERDDLKRHLKAAKENEEILSIEVNELKKEMRAIKEKPQIINEVQPDEYLSQLAETQANLAEHNQRITRLLEQVDVLKELEKKHLDTMHANESLQVQLRDFRHELSNKEAEIKQIRQQQVLIGELKERLEKAHEEYGLLQDKLDKLEDHISKPYNRTFEYEELQQAFFKLTKECDETRIRQFSMMEENQRLSRLLADTEDKLRESNFQRQQLTRKVTFLEELNTDLQQLSGHQKKLESQMRRIGEIEMFLNKNTEK